MFQETKQKLFHRLYQDDLQQFERKSAPVVSYVKPKDRVLDFGCGDGRFAKFFQEKTGCKILGIDLIDYVSEDIPYQIYGGKQLPFEDNKFDFVVCFGMLHHTKNPEENLKEVYRVGKKVILIEDYCSNKFGKLCLHFNDYFINIFQNFYKVWCGYRKGKVFEMQWKLYFKTEKELRDIFKRNGIDLEFFKRTARTRLGKSHGIYVLR